MEIDREKIKKRFSEISESLEEIGRLVSLNDDEFWSKKENIAAVKYYLLQAIEATGSACVHVAAKKFQKGVSVFGECFEILCKEGVLKEALAARLRKMTKFRNKLMHRYWEIDDKQVLDYARNNLNDFDEFMKIVGELTILNQVKHTTGQSKKRFKKKITKPRTVKTAEIIQKRIVT